MDWGMSGSTLPPWRPLAGAAAATSRSGPNGVKGRYRAVVYAGTDPLTGKPRYLRKSADTHALAQVELTKLLKSVDDQQHPKSDITVDEAITRWLDVAELQDTTRQRYEGLVRLYIQPTFGKRNMAKLDAELLERFYARLRHCKHLCAKPAADHECKPLSNSSIRQIHFILRAAVDRAVRWGYLSVNVVAMAEPPSFERPDPDPPTAEEVAAVLNEAWGDPRWGLFLWLTMVSGSRRGEMCALRWTDIDLARGVIAIERSYSQTAQRRREKSTKSGQKRRVAIDPYTVELLTAYRTQCEADCAKLGVTLARDAFVFSNAPDGSTPPLPSTMTQRYGRLANRAKLRSTRLHALRHYTATELLTAGVDLRTVAGRLGHGSGGATTLRFYAAWVSEADHRAAAAIGQLMPRPIPSKPEPQNPYEVLAAELRADIESGVLAPGTLIPTCTDLALAHGVSHATANRAVALLRSEGLVCTQRGHRTKVSAVVVACPYPE
jgi:integrase